MEVPDTARGKRLEADACMTAASRLVKDARELLRLAAEQTEREGDTDGTD
jgi:hypothetical protein